MDNDFLINFTPELWESAASRLRESYEARLQQIREELERNAVNLPKLALELEIAQRLNDSDAIAKCEEEVRAFVTDSTAILKAQMSCRLRLEELGEIMSEDGAYSRAMGTLMERFASSGNELGR